MHVVRIRWFCMQRGGCIWGWNANLKGAMWALHMHEYGLDLQTSRNVFERYGADGLLMKEGGN